MFRPLLCWILVCIPIVFPVTASAVEEPLRKLSADGVKNPEAEKAAAIAKQEAELLVAMKKVRDKSGTYFTGSKERDPVIKQYAEQCSNAIEAIGTRYFPTSAGKSLYGTVLVLIEVQRDGKLTSSSVERSSGIAELDAAVNSIVQVASSCQPFPESMAEKIETLSMVRTWQFKSIPSRRSASAPQ